MNHFNRSSQLLKTPTAEDLLAAELCAMFGFDYDHNTEPTIKTTLDDPPEEKSVAIEKTNQLLELRKLESNG